MHNPPYKLVASGLVNRSDAIPR